MHSIHTARLCIYTVKLQYEYTGSNNGTVQFRPFLLSPKSSYTRPLPQTPTLFLPSYISKLLPRLFPREDSYYHISISQSISPITKISSPFTMTDHALAAQTARFIKESFYTFWARVETSAPAPDPQPSWWMNFTDPGLVVDREAEKALRKCVFAAHNMKLFDCRLQLS